jgi:hypothetical protein
MRLRLVMLLTMLALMAVPSVFAGGKRDGKAAVTFHMQTEATDNPKMIFPQEVSGRTRYFLRMPEVATKDVVSFNPFPSDLGGGDYGMLIRLKSNAARRLSAITAANQGRWMVAQVNGRVVDGVLIDKQIDDGVLVIWKGLTMADVETFDKAFPRVGQEGKKN